MLSTLGALIVADPASAKKRIMHALLRARCDRVAAAIELETTYRSLYRYIDRLQLWPDIDQMIAENNFPVLRGPPRMHERIIDTIVETRGSIAQAAAKLNMDPDDMRTRLTSLKLWKIVNLRLEQAGLPPIEVPKRRAS
jgi:hypothetical protein